MLAPAVEVRLNGITLFIRAGALMPSPNHDLDSFGMGESYAHLFSDGSIMRYQECIGQKEDLEIVIEGRTEA